MFCAALLGRFYTLCACQSTLIGATWVTCCLCSLGCFARSNVYPAVHICIYCCCCCVYRYYTYVILRVQRRFIKIPEYRNVIASPSRDFQRQYSRHEPPLLLLCVFCVPKPNHSYTHTTTDQTRPDQTS